MSDDLADPRLAPGTDVAGYVIDEEIGKGGMGHVYSATHPVIGKRAAIKVLKPEVSKNPIVVERFIQEARAVNRIGHPNIIDIFAFGTLPDGRAYHVMDLLIGESLRKRLRRGPIVASEAASIIDETAAALSAAHEKGFVHRDLKPDNIYLQTRQERWPEVKLLDFGLAKLMPEGGVSPFQTKAGAMVGTPEYMSPEQARGDGVDYRTDVYALGIVMFEIITGRRPFATYADPFSQLMAHAEEPPPSLRDFAPDLPLEMIQLVDTMLAKDPAGRPSLAAVRTVIKRLRTTKLPTRTKQIELSRAGVSVPPHIIDDVAASLDRDSSLGITESRVGAAPIVATPNALRAAVAPAAPPVDPPPAPVPAQAPPAEPMPEPAPRASRPSFPAGAFLVPSESGSLRQPAASTHGGRSTGRKPSLPPTHGSGLAGPGPAGLTVLEFGSRTGGAAPQPPARPRDQPVGRGWLIIGAVIAIACGIAIALVVMR